MSKQLKMNLHEELERELGQRVVCSEVVHEHLRRVLPMTLPGAWQSSIAAQEEQSTDIIFLHPTTLQTLCQCLYHFDQHYASYNPTLFALYIPRLIPDQGLIKEREETLLFFARWNSSPHQPTKRKLTSTLIGPL